MAGIRKTLDEYLEWAKLKPRTSEWSALVAYDRGKCNQLLLQEYIEKHDKHSIMPPINEAYGSSETTWSWLIDYVTDAPRLSFENNPDTTSAEVNMSMAVVGGKNVSLDDLAGFAQVNRISSFDPLDYPKLEANRVPLKDIQGTVNKDGEVVLDLGLPESQLYIWEVKGDRIEHQRRMAGAFFKRKFKEADPQKRTFSLGKLAHTTQEFMKPQSFKLRTIMEQGAATRGAANFGNGAVEVRIAMDDEPQGGFPGEDWAYPLPIDRSDLNTLVIFGSRFFMHGIIGKGTARAFEAPTAEFVGDTNGQGFTLRIKAKEGTEGYLKVPEFQVIVGSRYLTFFGYTIPIYIDADSLLTMTLYHTAGGEPYFEVGMGSEHRLRQMNFYLNGAKSFNMGLGFSAKYNFAIDPSSRRLEVKLREYQTYLQVDDTELGEFPADVRDFMKSDQFKFRVGENVANAAMTLFNGLEDIDVFVLHTLFFNSEDAVQLKTLDLTGEMVMFGAINPRLTTFSIDPVEVMLGYGGTRQFRTEPQISGVTWRVEDLDGNATGAGRIDANGLYTAPPLADIHGTYKRVKIIATGPGSGSDRHISRALVTVVARAITLNPLIEICNASSGAQPETRKFSAHSMSGALKWRVNGDGDIDERADENGENTYRAPPKQDTGSPSFTVDEIVVENVATAQQQTSLVVLKHRLPMIVIDFDLQGLPPNQTKLIPTFNAQNPDPQYLTWSCLPAGAGSIDPATMIFTASETTNSQFVLITVLLDLMGMTFDGFIILPLPLASLPPKPAQPEIPQTSAFDELSSLLGEVYDKFEATNLDTDVRKKAKGYLDNIAALAEDAQNGQ
ncbi:hypothetical protein V3H56_20105 [Pseudomonas sp. MS646]|uniref:hypothetical protein n=1 Tax=Pseudomonas sp. MS646 TaxID=3118751 RepID=UPI0030CFBBD9